MVKDGKMEQGNRVAGCACASYELLRGFPSLPLGGKLASNKY